VNPFASSRRDAVLRAVLASTQNVDRALWAAGQLSRKGSLGTPCRIVLPTEWVQTQVRESTPLASWAVRNCFDEAVLLEVVDSANEELVLAMAQADAISDIVREALVARASSSVAIQQHLEWRARRNPLISESNRREEGDLEHWWQMAGDAGLDEDIRLDAVVEVLREIYTNTTLNAEELLGKLREELSFSLYRWGEFAKDFIDEHYYLPAESQPVGVEMGDILLALDEDDVSWFVFRYWLMASGVRELFTEKMLALLLESPVWRLGTLSRLSDRQYIEVSRRLAGGEHGWCALMASSRVQAECALSLLAKSETKLSVVASKNLVRWATGRSDPLVDQCLSLADGQSLVCYALGQWVDVKGRPLHPHLIEESLAILNAVTEITDDAITLTPENLLDWGTEVLARYGDGVALLDSPARNVLWEWFELSCGDVERGIDLLGSVEGTLHEISEAVRLVDGYSGKAAQPLATAIA
jgi:hypothetical protein